MGPHRMIFIGYLCAQLLAQGGGKSAGGRRNTGGCIRQGWDEPHLRSPENMILHPQTTSRSA